MIVLVNPLCHDHEHVQFDAGLTAAALHISPDAIFHGEARHLGHMRAMLTPELTSRVEWRDVRLPPRHGYQFPRRLVPEYKMLRPVMDEAIALNAEALVLAATPVLSAFTVMKVLHALRKHPVPTFAVVHGGLPKSLRRWRRRQLFAFGNRPSLRCVVLGHSMALEAAASVPAIAKTVCPLTHPILFDGTEPPPSALHATDMVFVSLGTSTVEKGFPAFVQFAREFSSTNVQFELIGRVNDEGRAALAGVAKGAVRVHGGQAQIPRSLYLERLRIASYALFPHDPVAYQFVCSGSMLDAIWAAKPIVALRTSTAVELFSRLGDIGHLCGDVNEMRSIIRTLIERPDPVRYAHQSARLAEGRKLFGPEAVGAELREAIKMVRQ